MNEDVHLNLIDRLDPSKVEFETKSPDDKVVQLTMVLIYILIYIYF
jgi:hypothetical protein